ncbi:MAG: hypothetical protein ACYTGL_07220, partial [Planctomycetota bacterium]
MQLRNWLSPYTQLASRTNWVRRARRYLSRRALQNSPGYVGPGLEVGLSRWYSSPRMSRALQRQDFCVASISNAERLEDRTLLAADLLVSVSMGTEAAGTVVTVTLDNNGVNVTGDQTASLSVSGTGITAADYVLSNSVVTIPDGQSSGSVMFTIQDDAFVEATSETATIQASGHSAGITPGVTMRTISITDDESATVTYSGTASATEGGSTGTTVATLSLSSNDGAAVLKVPVSATITSSTSDFTASTVMWAADESAGGKNITVTATDDV